MSSCACRVAPRNAEERRCVCASTCACVAPTAADVRLRVAPFVGTLYRLLCSPAHAAHIRWLSSSHFVVRNVNAFAASVLPLFFSHSNWTSFLRQLTNYGFERGSVPEPVTAATDGFVFTHAVFRRGRPDALPRVVRVRKRGRRSVEPTPDAPVRAAEAPTPPTPSTHAGAASDAPTSISKRTRAGPTASLSASDTLSATAAMPILAALGSPAPLEPLLSGQTSEPNAPTSAAATLPQRSTFDVTDGASVHTIWSEIVSIRAELHSLRAGQQELLHALHQHSSCRNMQSLSSAGSTLAMDLFDQDSDALFGSAL